MDTALELSAVLGVVAIDELTVRLQADYRERIEVEREALVTFLRQCFDRERRSVGGRRRKSGILHRLNGLRSGDYLRSICGFANIPRRDVLGNFGGSSSLNISIKRLCGVST